MYCTRQRTGASCLAAHASCVYVSMLLHACSMSPAPPTPVCFAFGYRGLLGATATATATLPMLLAILAAAGYRHRCSTLTQSLEVQLVRVETVEQVNRKLQGEEKVMISCTTFSPSRLFQAYPNTVKGVRQLMIRPHIHPLARPCWVPPTVRAASFCFLPFIRFSVCPLRAPRRRLPSLGPTDASVLTPCSVYA